MQKRLRETLPRTILLINSFHIMCFGGAFPLSKLLSDPHYFPTDRTACYFYVFLKNKTENQNEQIKFNQKKTKTKQKPVKNKKVSSPQNTNHGVCFVWANLYL